MKPVPFFSNPDNSHCYQCCLRMILRFFRPHEKYSWKQLDKMTEKKDGLWTWAWHGVLEMKKQGFEVVFMQQFDYKRFAEIGETYLKERFGEETTEAIVKNSDLPFEQDAAKTLSELIEPTEVPTLADLKRLLAEGYLAICNVNLNLLNGQEGFSGHFVLVFEIDETTVYAHDPGHPPAPNRQIPIESFEKAWAFPNESDKTIIAMKPNR